DALLAALAPRRVTRRHGFAAALAIASIATVGWLRDRGGADRSECDAASDAIATTWNRGVAARLDGPDRHAAVSAIEGWVSSWRSARRGACRAASERTISASVLAGRTACYERARATFDASLAATLAKPPGAVKELAARLPSIDPCASDVSLPIDPGVVDTRGCRCPYSACSADGRCLSACDAPAFRVDHLLSGISLPGRQELLLGVSLDGDTVLYLAGEDGDLASSDVPRHCGLRHLFVARRRGAAFAPVELTRQIDDSLGVFEACCTLAPDGRSIIVSRADRRGFVRLALDGDRLVRAPDDEFAALTRDLPPDDALQFPLLAPDQLTLYYRISQHAESPSPVIGSYTTSRRQPGTAFPPGRLVDGVPYPAHSDEYLTGVSEDGLTLFLSRRYNTYALVRATLADGFHEPDFGSRLVPWRLAPLRGCRQLIANVSIGGCEAEDIAILSAAPR
ncbi:MAG TPA: hypothetical protein VGD80_04305, partial [Kofleriaceae bacterium]